MECISKFQRLPCTQNSLFTEKCPFGTHPNLHKHLRHTVTGIKIIIDNQCFQTFQLCDFLCAAVLRLKSQCQADNKFGAFALFCLIKALNIFHRKKEEAPAAPPAPSNEEILLTEIRDLLKERP